MSSTNIFRLSVLVMFLCWIPIVGYLSQFAIIDGWSIPYALLRPWIGWSAVLIALSAHVWKPQRIFFVLGVVNAWIALQDFSVRSPSNKGISVLSWNVGTPSIGTKESQSLECVLIPFALGKTNIKIKIVVFCFYRKSNKIVPIF